jgi:hypothetical protein
MEARNSELGLPKISLGTPVKLPFENSPLHDFKPTLGRVE